MNPVTLHVLDYTLNADGSLATITIASPENLKSYVYTTTFLETADNTVYNEKNTVDIEDPSNGRNQRNPYNGF
jgi:hypothetical protein